MDQMSLLPQKRLNSNLIYQLVPGDLDQPFFFCGLRRRIAEPGRWTAPCALYAVHNWAPGHDFIGAESIEGLAADHVRRLREIQPNGPYMLGGYCHWAIVAYEMAQQLQASGEDVSLLFLVDPMAVNRPHGSGAAPPAPLARRSRDRLKAVLKGPQKGGWLAWLYLLFPLHAQINRIKQRVEFRSVQRALRKGQSLPHQRIFESYWRKTGNWYRRYTSPTYHGRCRIVLTSASPRHLRLDQFGDELQVRSIESGHADVFKAEAMDQWVPWLIEEIDAARRRPLAMPGDRLDEAVRSATQAGRTTTFVWTGVRA
jgi:thioesterase domain-containing protein